MIMLVLNSDLKWTNVPPLADECERSVQMSNTADNSLCIVKVNIQLK